MTRKRRQLKHLDAIRNRRKKVQNRSEVEVSIPGPSGIQVPTTPESQVPPALVIGKTSSAKKRKLLFNISDTSSQSDSDTLLKQRPRVLLSQEDCESILKNVVCKNCGHDLDMVFEETKYGRTKFVLSCPICDEEIYSHKEKKSKGYSPQLLELVYCTMCGGDSYLSLKRTMASYGLGSISGWAYNKYKKKIVSTSVEKTNSHLDECAERIRDYYAVELMRDPDEDGILDIDVSFDGSWQVRGHSSNLGVGLVIEAHTGIVLDYEVLCKKCTGCAQMKNKLKEQKITQEKYDSWNAAHQPQCTINYAESSGSMEQEEALQMWNRSIDRKLRYTTLLGDGDSSTYAALRDQIPYGQDITVVKEKCVNHFHIHARISELCPKIKNMGKLTCDFATSQSILNYNLGYEKGHLGKELKIPMSEGGRLVLKALDKKREETIKIRPKMKRKIIADEHYGAGTADDE